MELILQMNAEGAIEVDKERNFKALAESLRHTARRVQKQQSQAPSMTVRAPSQLRHQRSTPMPEAPHLRGHQAVELQMTLTPQTTK